MGKEKQIEERAEKAGVDGGVAQVLQLGAAREHVWSRARQFHIRMHPHSVSHIERLNNQRALRRRSGGYHTGGYRHFYHLLDLSKNYQNHVFCSLWGLLTYLTTIKLIKIFLHANSELCSSHTALFQANFVIFYIFFET